MVMSKREILQCGNLRYVLCYDDWWRINRLCEAELLAAAGVTCFTGMLPLDHPELVRENLEAFHRQGIVVLAWLPNPALDFRLSPEIEQAFPDRESMAARACDGQVKTRYVCIDPFTPGLYLPTKTNRIGCYNNPAVMRFVQAVIKACIALGPDGVFFDHLWSFGNNTTFPCWCDHCREEFGEYALRVLGRREAIPKEMDQKDDLVRFYQRWTWEATNRFYREIWRLVKGINEEILITAVLHGDWPSHMHMIDQGYLDFPFFEESYDYAPQNVIYTYSIGRAAGAPIAATVTRTAECIPSPSQLKAGLAGAVAFGGAFVPWMEYIHESSDLMRALREYNAFFQQYQHLYSQAQSLAQVGILYSYSSHAFQKWEKDGANTCKALSQMLMDLHVPHRILLVEKLPKEAALLKGLEVLFVTESPALSPEAEVLLADFVRQGGALAMLEGVGTDEESVEEEFRRFLNGLVGRATVGETVGEMTTETGVGKGKVCHIQDLSVRNYLRERKKWLDPIHPLNPPEPLQDFLGRSLQSPLLRVEAHPLTAVNLTRTGGTILLHLVNHNCGRFTQVHLLPGRNVRIELKLPTGTSLQRAFQLSPDVKGYAGEVTGLSLEGDILKLTLPELKVYSVIVCECV